MTMMRIWSGKAEIEVELEVVAVIGRCRVVRLSTGRLEIRGGDGADLGVAREWASMFCHEALPRVEGR